MVDQNNKCKNKRNRFSYLSTRKFYYSYSDIVFTPFVYLLNNKTNNFLKLLVFVKNDIYTLRLS